MDVIFQNLFSSENFMAGWSQRASQPMVSEDGRLVVVFNRKIYNPHALAAPVRASFGRGALAAIVYVAVLRLLPTLSNSSISTGAA